MKITVDKVLAGIGFIIGGIGMARTFSDLPDDARAVKNRFVADQKADDPTEKKDE